MPEIRDQPVREIDSRACPFAQRLTEGLSEEDLTHFRRCVAVFSRNIDCIRRGGTNRKNNRSEEPK